MPAQTVDATPLEIKLRGNVRLFFEDFSLYSEACPNKSPGIWLAFGGDVATPTMSTVNDTVRRPGFTPEIGGASVSLTKDDNFERFFALISARHGHDTDTPWGQLYNVNATLTGIFLAGNRKFVNGKVGLPGYGHLGAYYLLLITQVDAVDSVPPAHLSVSGTVMSADGKPLTGVDVYSQTVNCCQPWVSRARSDDAGLFAIRNAGQVLTFLKAGYSPKSIVLETGGNSVDVTLETRPADDWQIATCKKMLSPQHRFHGLPLSVSIPHGLHTEQVSPSPNPRFAISRKRGYDFIRLLKSDPKAPYGETASRLFGSEKYTQRNVVDGNGKQIGIDTRGQRDKVFWRILAMPGLETVEFNNSPRETADLFDRAIDSACFQAH